MAIPVARVHLAVAHAALPALLPTPPKCKMLPLLPTPCLAAIPLAKPLPNKPSRADADERWDVHKIKSGSTASSTPRSPDSVKNGAGRRSYRKNATSPLPKPGRADSADRWDAHKKSAVVASSSSSSITSSFVSSTCTISRSSSAERWDVNKKRRPTQTEPLDDGESSCTSSNDDMDMEDEEILWKPRAMYAGPGFVAAVPAPSLLPMPTAFLVGVV